MAQMLECLLCKREALSSNFSPIKEKEFLELFRDIKKASQSSQP
jgi:hypothetical protein